MRSRIDPNVWNWGIAGLHVVEFQDAMSTPEPEFPIIKTGDII